MVNEDAGPILSEMVQIARTFRVAGQRRRERSLTGSAYGFLKYLSHGDARLSELSQHLFVSMSVASRTMDTLEAAGRVSRRPDPEDARAALISITDSGHAYLAETNERIVGRFAESLADWSDEESRQALDILRRLNGHLRELTDMGEHAGNGDAQRTHPSTFDNDGIENRG